jgi:hypothetical protein
LHLLLLTWEFPPRVVGEVSPDMEAAAIGLAEKKCKVDVITYHESQVGIQERKEGFRVHRVSNPVRYHVNIVTWAMTLNTEFERVATDIFAASNEKPLLVHASEWLCVPAAIQLKKILQLPFTLSLHSIEPERSFGGTISGSISYLERSGCREAMMVIVNKTSTAEAVRRAYSIPEGQMVVLESSRHNLADELMECLGKLVSRGEGTNPAEAK